MRRVISRKLDAQAPAPSTVLPDVDAELDQLCVALLNRDPGGRPDAAEILRVLHAKADT
jgi:hypothetical protein